MRLTFAALAVCLFLVAPARAQDAAAPAAPAPDATTTAAAAVSAATSASALNPDNWLPIGQTFGPNAAWQFGIDKSATLGACFFDGFARGQGPKYIVGPCRDLVVLAKSGTPLYHVGILPLGYDVRDVTQSHPYYLARFGVNVGPAASAFLTKVAGNVPYVENLLAWQAPAPLAYLGSITTIDGGGGPGLHAKPIYGGSLKVNIPLADLEALVAGLVNK